MYARFYLFLCFIMLFCLNVSYANTPDSIANASQGTKNFEELFRSIEKGSPSYQEYKLIKKTDIGVLISAYNDDVSRFKNSVKTLQDQLQLVQAENTKLKTTNAQLTTQVTDLTAEAEKSLAKIYLIIIVVLFLVLAYFVYQYKVLLNGKKTHKENINLLETEFEEYKRSAIEREQKIKRELINVKNSLAKAKDSSPKSGIELKDKRTDQKPVSKKIDLDELLTKGISSDNKEDKSKKNE